MIKDQLIQALELDKQGNWDAAHKIVQSYNSLEAYVGSMPICIEKKEI